MEYKTDLHEILHYLRRSDGSSFNLSDLCIRSNAIYQKSKALLSALESDSFCDEETLDGICMFMKDYIKEVQQLRDDIQSFKHFVSEKCDKTKENE